MSLKQIVRKITTRKKNVEDWLNNKISSEELLKRMKRETKKYCWTWAYLQDPLKELKTPQKNFTDEKTIQRWRQVQNERYDPNRD